MVNVRALVRRRRAVVLGSVALAALGVSLALVLGRAPAEPTLVAAEPTTAPAEPAATRDFWDFGVAASPPAWGPESLDELAEPPDVIVVGTVRDVIDGGPMVGLRGDDTGLDLAYLDVAVETVLAGMIGPPGSGSIRVSMPKSGELSYASIRGSIPNQRLMFFLYDVHTAAVRGAEREGLDLALAEKFRDVFAPLGPLGIVTATPTGLEFAQTSFGGELLRSFGTLDDLAVQVQRIREACDKRRDCLRDVFNPAGSFRGGLSDPYPALGWPGDRPADAQP